MLINILKHFYAENSDRRLKPEVITDQNISNYKIHDLVLPAPGYDVVYPEGEMLEKYKELLADDGFGLDSFRHKIKFVVVNI